MCARACALGYSGDTASSNYASSFGLNCFPSSILLQGWSTRFKVRTSGKPTTQAISGRREVTLNDKPAVELPCCYSRCLNLSAVQKRNLLVDHIHKFRHISVPQTVQAGSRPCESSGSGQFCFVRLKEKIIEESQETQSMKKTCTNNVLVGPAFREYAITTRNILNEHKQSKWMMEPAKKRNGLQEDSTVSPPESFEW